MDLYLASVRFKTKLLSQIMNILFSHLLLYSQDLNINMQKVRQQSIVTIRRRVRPGPPKDGFRIMNMIEGSHLPLLEMALFPPIVRDIPWCTLQHVKVETPMKRCSVTSLIMFSFYFHEIKKGNVSLHALKDVTTLCPSTNDETILKYLCTCR